MMIKDRQCAVCHKWETHDLSGGGVRFVVIGPMCGSCHTSHENQAAELTRLKAENDGLRVLTNKLVGSEIVQAEVDIITKQAKTIERLRGFLSEFNKHRSPIVDFYWNESERASGVYVFEDGSTTEYTEEIAEADCGHSRLQIALRQCKDLPKPPKTQAPDNP